MSGVLLTRLGRLSLVAVICSAVVFPVAGCAATDVGGQALKPTRAGTGHAAHTPSRARPSPGQAVPVGVVPAIGGDPAQLAGQLTAAERALSDRAATPVVLARQALIVELACLRLTAHPAWASAVTGKVASPLRAAAAAGVIRRTAKGAAVAACATGSRRAGL